MRCFRRIGAKVLNRRKILIAIGTTYVPYFGLRNRRIHYSSSRRCYVRGYVVAVTLGGSQKISHKADLRA